MIRDIISDIIALIKANTNYSVVIGSLPVDNNSLCIAPTSGAPTTTFMNKSSTNAMTLVLNGKSLSQTDLLDTLDNVHRALTMRKTYTDNSEYQITNIATVSSPTYIEGEPTKSYIYGSAIKVEYYAKGV